MRSTVSGSRMYAVNQEKLPSVTSILQATQSEEKKASLANWLNRSDLTTEIADDFIKLAEADFNSKLRVRAMIAQVSITVNAETEALPTDFLQARDFYTLSGQTKTPLVYTTPASMDTTTGTSTTGKPTSFTILGDTIRFSPVPDASYTAFLNYYKL